MRDIIEEPKTITRIFEGPQFSWSETQFDISINMLQYSIVSHN